MAVSIPQIVGQFKTDVTKALSADTIVKICRDLDYSWRDRVLDPVTTVHVFLLQILHGNIACTAMSRLAGVAFTAGAYCSARARLPLALFENLLIGLCATLKAKTEDIGLWLGHRTWSLDGSSFSMPDTKELREYFGQPSGQAKGCGFPVAHMLALFHAGTGCLLRVLASPMRTHDMRHSPLMHPEMGVGDILLADRGFSSFAHLALLFMRGIHSVFRSHQNQIVNFRVGRKHTKQKKSRKGMPRSRYVKRLGRWDQLVEYTKPTKKPVWMEDATWDNLPLTLVVRELRYLTPQRGYRTRVITLVTTLLDPEIYSAAALGQLYLSRWQIELNFRHLKTTMKMEVLHCKSVDGVLKEMYMFAIVYNLIRLVMLEAADRQKVLLDRISFIDALRWLQVAKVDTPLTPLVVNPARPGRLEPRVIKRRMKEYRLMKQPREKLRKRLSRKKVEA